MISFIVRMQFSAEDRTEIEAALAPLTAASREEPGCRIYVPSWSEGESATLVIFEQYTDESAVEAHRGTPHFARYATGVLYQKMLSRAVEHLSAIA